MPSILDSVSDGLILAGPEDEGVSAEQVLSRLNATLLPHQTAFCEDQEHRILGLVSGFGAGKTYGLCAKAINIAAANIGYVSAIFEPVAPMLRDILVRSMDELKWPATPTDVLEEHGPALPNSPGIHTMLPHS